MDVLSLLQNKKRCLRHLLALSEGFAELAEQGNLSSLNLFETQREGVFKALAMFDRKLTAAVQALSAEERTPDLSLGARRSLEDEAFLVQSILNADNRILKAIEGEKARLTREMNSAQKSKELAGRFKSSWIAESGEELDRKV